MDIKKLNKKVFNKDWGLYISMIIMTIVFILMMISRIN